MHDSVPQTAWENVKFIGRKFQLLKLFIIILDENVDRFKWNVIYYFYLQTFFSFVAHFISLLGHSQH